MYSLFIMLSLIGTPSDLDREIFKMGGDMLPPQVITQASPDYSLIKIASQLDKIELRLARLENKVSEPIATAPAPIKQTYVTVPQPVQYLPAASTQYYGRYYTTGSSCSSGQCGR